MADIVRLPPFHKNQKAVYDDDTRFKVLVAGRRFGKSWFARMVGLEQAINAGKTVWWVSPTYNNVSTHWRATLNMVGDLPTYRNVQQKYLEFNYKGLRGSLAFKSGDRPNNLRGEGLDLCVLDEAAFMPAEVWESVIRPALSDRKGQAIIISTPNGTGDWFHRSYMRGLTGEDAEWKSFHFPTTANLAIPGIKEEVEAARQDLSDIRFRQEYLAEFVDYAGGVFFGLKEAAVERPLAGPHPDKVYVAGIDLGRHNDFTVISILELTDRGARQVAIERFTDVGFSIQKDRISSIIKKWNIITAYMENNSIAMSTVEDLQRDGLPIRSVTVTAANKGMMIEALSANLQRGNLTLLGTDVSVGAIQMSELQAFEMSRSTAGFIRYAAKSGWHDDTVMSLTLANLSLKTRSVALSIAENPFY